MRITKSFLYNFNNHPKIIFIEEEFERDREELGEERQIVETEDVCRGQNGNGDFVWQPGCKMAEVRTFGGHQPSHPPRNILK